MTTTVAPVAINPELQRRLKRAATNQEKWTRERDEVIVEAHASGGSLREIGAFVGLSHVGVMKIIARHEGLEAAHIKPRSEGGSDDEENLMFLTTEENRRARDQ